MSTQYRCKNERRRETVRDAVQPNGQPVLNGIDYLEVSADPKTLVVRFLHDLQNVTLSKDQVLISGGTRLQNVQVESVSGFANVMMVQVNRVGDFSTYSLRLVQSETNLNPPSGFDPQLAQVDFSFWVDEFSEFDCKPPAPSPESAPPPPTIDYLAKDYASFRRLMLDRLTVTMPNWQERSPADLGVMLVELMAYAADHLSYYQDAIATESYLGTARRRVSIRRHTRLLDYLMHDGCNARVWIAIQAGITARGIRILPGVKLFTKVTGFDPVIPADKFDNVLNIGTQIFETMEAVMLYPECNEIYFYPWDNRQCTLPKGSTQATLRDPSGLLQEQLKPGTVLILEEVKDPSTGLTAGADLNHRHVVRLQRSQGTVDPLNQEKIVDIEWAPGDVLPFDLRISSVDAQDRPIDNISVVRGNVVLADFGRSLPTESLNHASGWNRLRPRLQRGPLTQQGYVTNRQNQWVLFDEEAPASTAMTWKMRDTQPAIAVWEDHNPELTWRIQRDLLNSDRFARDFVVETEEDGRAYLRFGDGSLGRRPPADTPLQVQYRIGNGRVGNVGAEAIAHILPLPENLEEDARPQFTDLVQGILGVRNPLPAQGGTDPEPIEQVKLYAPQAFRSQRRAVTEADYAAIAQTYPGVQKALASRRWTGSWQTIFITVDRTGGLPVDADFKRGLLNYLEEFRLSGHDIEIDNPRFVPLDLAIAVQVAPDYFRSAIKKELLDSFSDRLLSDGRSGFFAPDQFTFGQSVYLSQVVATAMRVVGVAAVKVTRFQRWGEAPRRELETGQIAFDRLEIARLDNDPTAPENGRITFELKGGQ